MCVKKFLYFLSFVLFIFGIGFILYYFHLVSLKVIVSDIDYSDGEFVVSLDNFDKYTFCAISSNSDDLEFNSANNGVCRYGVDEFGSYKLYIKHYDEINSYDVDKFFNVEFSKKNYYLAVGDSVNIKYKSLSIGNVDTSLFDVSNSSVVSLKGNKIYGKKKGTAYISFGDKKIKVVVTDLIDKVPRKYNYSRSYIPCGVFDSDEEKLLDKILADRINEAGYGSRAGVVAAARFLLLEFPYRIKYFSENGRVGGYSNVDGEGRFYHKGLYLTSSKYSSISVSDKGPKPWGCSLYSRPSKGYRSNGLDCSGFTTWALYNGGFDVGDIGAHSLNSTDDLNSIGEEVALDYEVSVSDRIKAGDLLGEVTVSEGHSALVVGVDSKNYYVAESLWIEPLGVNINTYKKEELSKYFETVNLLDSYYKKDGNYTAMW